MPRRAWGDADRSLGIRGRKTLYKCQSVTCCGGWRVSEAVLLRHTEHTSYGRQVDWDEGKCAYGVGLMGLHLLSHQHEKKLSITTR
jgi:hypothetical protein